VALGDNNKNNRDTPNSKSPWKLAETGTKASESDEKITKPSDENPAQTSTNDSPHKPETSDTNEDLSSTSIENSDNHSEALSSESVDEQKFDDNQEESVLKPTGSKIKPLIGILVIILILVSGYIVWFKYYKNNAAEVIEPVSTTAVAPEKTIKPEVIPTDNIDETIIETPDALVDSATPVPTEVSSYLNSIEYSENFEFPKIDIDLSKKVFYQIYESPGEITLVFPDTKSNSNLIEMNNNFIKLVNVNYFKNQTTVNLVLQDDIKLGNIGYADGTNRLQLSFQNILTKRNMDVSQIKSVQTSESLSQIQQREYYQALDVANTGDYPKAIKLMKPLTEGDDVYMPAVESLAVLYLKSLRIDDAELLLSRAVNQYPANIKIKEYYARLFIIKNQFPQALSFLMKASPSLPKHPDYYGLIAFLNLEEHKPKVAQVYYMQLSELMPDNAKWLLGLAMALRMQGANNAANAIYQKILANGNISPSVKIYVNQQVQ
jgi:tetratricopeptide (TPR) repeat protein